MRRLLAVLVLAVAPLAAVAQAPEAPAISVDYERFQLDNGLDVILHRDPSVPTVAVNTWYHVGSGRERPGWTGFAHLFEHLMFEGSGHVPEGAIDTWLEEAGGGANGSTTRDRTNDTTDAASNGLELALYLDADRMAPLLDAMSPESVEGQRDVVKNERRQSYENRPYGLAFSVLGQTLYPPDHPYHWPTIGSMDDLSAARYDDVVDFFETYYTPNNASLVVAGDIDVAEACKTILGGSFTSRLNQNLRERNGYSYGAGSSFDYRPVAGPFVASSDVQTAATAPALTEFFRELEGVSETVPAGELAKARDYLALSFPSPFATVRGTAARVGDLWLSDLPADTYARYTEGVQAVTAEDLERVAREYVDPERVVVVVVGDRAAVEADVRALDLGPVTALTIEDVLGPAPAE